LGEFLDALDNHQSCERLKMAALSRKPKKLATDSIRPIADYRPKTKTANKGGLRTANDG